MAIFKQIKSLEGDRFDLHIPSKEESCIDASELTVLPALIDPHVHFRVPGHEHKETWISAARACIAGGVTTVFDMPNNYPSCVTLENLREKTQRIHQQLNEADIPLRFNLYFGADKKHFDEIPRAKAEIIGIKVFMGSSTGDLLIDDDASLESVFRIAEKYDLVVAVHAEDEELIKVNQHCFFGINDPAVHSKIRSPEAAEKAVLRALSLAERFNVRLYILHVSTKKEVEAIRAAKAKGLNILAEATPHHLFLSEEEYTTQGMRVKVNPPLRSLEDQLSLWKAIQDGTIDTIGTDHAPHPLSEKALSYHQAPSGVPGVETLLPLLLDAYNGGKISLSQIVALTRSNIQKFFNLPPNDDWVLVNLNLMKQVGESRLYTKCQWSPFSGKNLKGWPVYTILNHRIYHVI